MDAALIACLEQMASVPRLARYRAACNSDLEAATVYLWNIQLAEALYPSLAVFEVALRNAVHNTLTTKYGTDFWFQSVLTPKAWAEVSKLIARLTQNLQQPPTSGKVVSELTFGLWVNLFAHRYHNLWWSPPNSLLPFAFPNHPAITRDTRKRIFARLEYLLRLRNRVMHHEVIFGGVAALNRSVLAVDVLHDQLIETIGWINADAEKTVACMDRFNEVHDHGKVAMEAKIKDKFGIP